MSPNGHRFAPRQVPTLDGLPRPLYARRESLPQAMRTPRHAHPWVQLSYAIAGVLHVYSDAGCFVAPPRRAIWIPAHAEHEVVSAAGTEMRSLYLDTRVCDWAPERFQVLTIDSLCHELIRRFCALPAEYDETGADGRLAQVLLDQLRRAPAVSLSLPLPADARLLQLYQQLQAQPEDSRSLDAWAASLGVSSKTLSRLFLRETGLSFRLWRQRLRLLSALEPLARGERVTDVALSCGYESTSAFIAAFGQQFGQTPGAFFSAPG